VNAWIVEYNTTIAWVVAAVIAAIVLLVSLLTPKKRLLRRLSSWVLIDRYLTID